MSINPTISGTVQVTTRKFESNTARLLTQKEGESKAKMVAIAVLGFIPAVFSDIVRFALFKANLIDGKSFSFMDHASSATQTLAAKVNAAWENYKNPSFTVKNERSKSNLQAKAKNLVNAYIALDRNFLGQTRPSFSSLGEQAVRQAQKDLLGAVESHLKLNVDSSIDPKSFALQFQSTKELVQKFITESSGNEIYIKTKGVRVPNKAPIALSTVVNSEFATQLDAVKGLHFKAVCNTPSFVATIAKEVANNTLTKPQAEQALLAHVKGVYLHALSSLGLDKARTVSAAMINEAVKANLIDDKTATQILESSASNIEVETLAKGVAIDVVNAQEEKPGLLVGAEKSDMITQTAEFLVENKYLEANDKSIFCTAVDRETKKIQAKKAAQKEAYAALNGFAKDQLAARKAAEIAAAKAAEEQAAIELEAQKEAARKQALEDKCKEFLGIVSKAEGEFSSKVAESVAKEKEIQTTNDAITALLDKKVQTSKGPITLLLATQFYYTEVAKINRLPISPEERTKQCAALVNNDQETLTSIQLLGSLQTKINGLNQERTVLAKEIAEKQEKFSKLFQIYKAFEAESDLTLVEASKMAASSSKVAPLTKEEVAQISKIVDAIIEENKPAPVKAAVVQPKPTRWQNFIGFVDAHADALIKA